MIGLSGLTPELIASSIVGITMTGIVLKQAIAGFMEARAKMREHEKTFTSNPFTAIAGAVWDRDQVERFLQHVEEIAQSLALQAKCTEMIAKSQGIMSDNFQQSTQSKLNDLLAKLDGVKEPKTRPRPKRKPRPAT